MGKPSSSSRKKKRSKASSQARKRKGSKIRSRKHESRKLRRRFSDDDDSRSSSSGSSSFSSSSEDVKYRSKRSQFRTRKDVKISKKRARRRPYGSDSSGDSPGVSKRKGSKRKRDYEDKNKKYMKKKRRREHSTSSTSSGSWSCSTCQENGSGSNHEVEFGRHRSKRGKEGKDERISGEVESATKRSRYRSRSPSCSQCSESSTHQSEEKVWVENNSRRLRSVIIVVERDREEEDRQLSKDEDKEEIIHIHGDYPPCRSNDSNDAGNKWEEEDHSSHDEVEKIRLENENESKNEKGDDTAISELRSGEHTKSGNVADNKNGSRFDGSKHSYDECGTTETVNSDDLELILRQRALENLRRFRGGRGRTAANQNDKSKGDVKQSSISNAESVQTRSSMEDDSRLVGANFSKEDGAEKVVSTETQSGNAVEVPVTGKETSCSSEFDKNLTDRKSCENESVSAEQNVARSVHQTTVAGNSKDKVSAGISVVQPKLTTSEFTRQLLKPCSTPKQVLERKEPRANLLLSKSSLDETVAVTAPTVTQKNSNNNNNADINNACGAAASEPSSLKSATIDTGSEKPQEEAHEGSQFEQKTMSVMRGGEMVKVNYKVYIPKKPPALGRRQLKR